MHARELTRLLFLSALGGSWWCTGVVALLGCWLTAFAEPLDIWHWRNPTPTGNELYGIGANAQRYVAVGEFGTILVSDDGNNWLTVESGTQATLRAVAWGNGLWVAVGDFGEILTSPDGTNWMPRSIGLFFDLMGITWGGGLFVAVGSNTSILTSPDGIVWTLRATGTHPLRAVAWANGTFVAAGGEPPKTVPSGQFSQRIPGQPLVLVSADGVAWNRAETPVEGQISCVAFGAGRFVAATTSIRTMVSTNGIDWLPGFESAGNAGMEFFAVAHFGDGFIATYGSPSTLPGGHFASTDGIRWTSESWDMANGPFYGNVRALVAGPRGVAGVAGGLTYSFLNYLITSPDGRKWRRCEERLPEIEAPVTFAGGRFFVRERAAYVNYQLKSETRYLVSLDGLKWESAEVSATAWFGLPAYGNGVWVAGGGRGAVAVSTNAVDWQECATGETNQLEHSAFAGGTFVLSGTKGTLVTSADGANWRRATIDTTNTLGRVAWSGNVFAVAEIGATAVFTSPDSILWTRGLMPPNVVAVETVTGWEEGFVALVRTNPFGPAQLLRSTDCRAWLSEEVPADSIHLMATGGGKLVAFRGDGSRTFHARRAGATNWTTHVLPWISTGNTVAFDSPASAVFGRDTFVLTHGAGFVLQSDPLTNIPARVTQPLGAVAIALDAQVTLRAMALGSAPLRYHWRREGTNLPVASSPFLSLRADEVSANRITVVVENAFGMAESAPATVAMATPAKLEILPDLSSMRAWGTPNGRYQIEFTQDLAAAGVWSLFGEVEIPSFGTPARAKNLSAYDYGPVPQRFYRAVIRP